MMLRLSVDSSPQNKKKKKKKIIKTKHKNTREREKSNHEVTTYLPVCRPAAAFYDDKKRLEERR